METYLEQKKRHQAEYSAFEGIFFAFSTEQLKEGIEKFGVNEDNKMVNIGAGGFVLKSRLQALKDMLSRHDTERKELRKDTNKLIDAIAYELANHEYCITYNVEDALRALDLTVDSVPADILKKAIKKHNERMVNV